VRPCTARRQQGAAIIALLALVGIVFSAILLTAMSGASTESEQDLQTARALSVAHRALIDYAVSVQPDTDVKRPGDLPCPDLDNDGDAEPTCSAASERIGRLPVETLELYDLVDGHGERLWYALSGNFDRSTVNRCPTPGGPNCLNSETVGTLTVRDQAGNTIHDGTVLGSGAIAVVFSPGPPIVRQGASTPQDRSCAGDGNVAACQATSTCSGTTGATALCNAVNYLEVVGAPLPPEDNADFLDGSTANGFIAGPVRDAGGNLLVNDRLVVLRHSDLIPRLEQRVAREVLRCLANYATTNGQRYPWAASVTADYTTALADQTNLRFGRLANSLPSSLASGLSGTWPADCPIRMATSPQAWWANWQNLMFYAVAPEHAPDASMVGCGTCLSVNGAPGRRVVVLAADRPLTGQVRGVGTAAVHYLEAPNEVGGPAFTRDVASGTFNDYVLSE
jgi:type II secretory pathway pseudopilin PulG